MPIDEIESVVPPNVLDRLTAEQHFERQHEHGQLLVSCQVFNGLVSLLPARQEIGADFVHLNSDSFWLLQLAWKYGTGGDHAAELGTGNGIVAAHLVARYRRVIATDLPGPWMRYAQLTLAANQGRGRPSAAIACDIAGALRPGMFDLVVSNSPWSPNPPLDEHGRTQTFMDGGPTGTELPGRFLTEAADLLAPGGTAIVLCLDPRFVDGRAPLQPILERLRPRFDVTDIESEVIETGFLTERLKASRLPDLDWARHVAIVIRRGR